MWKETASPVVGGVITQDHLSIFAREHLVEICQSAKERVSDLMEFEVVDLFAIDRKNVGNHQLICVYKDHSDYSHNDAVGIESWADWFLHSGDLFDFLKNMLLGQPLHHIYGVLR